MCILLKTTPDDILLHEGKTPEETAKCLEDIETVRKLVEAEGVKEAPDPKIEGVSAEAQEILDYIRDATPAELAEVCRYIGYLKSKRGTAEEMLGMRLAVMHNLYFYNKLTQRIRDSLDSGTFDEFRAVYSKKLAEKI